MPGRPFQHALVIRSREANVLDSNQIDVGISETNASNDVVVEVLVGEQPDHAESCPVWRANRRARTPVGSKSRSFDCLTSAERCSRAWR